MLDSRLTHGNTYSKTGKYCVESRVGTACGGIQAPVRPLLHSKYGIYEGAIPRPEIKALNQAPFRSPDMAVLPIDVQDRVVSQKRQASNCTCD